MVKKVPVPGKSALYWNLSLTFQPIRVKSNLAVGPVAQLGERYNRTVEAKGSNPFRSIAPYN